MTNKAESTKQELIVDEDENVSDYLFNLMNNNSDSVIASFSQLNPDIPNNKQEPHSSSSRIPGDEPGKKLERMRRASFNNYYTTLQSMLPNIGRNNKVPKATIVSEAIDYIEELKESLQVLEACKQEKEIGSASMSKTYTSKSSNVDVMVSGEMAFFGIYLMSGRGLVAKVLMVFGEEDKAEVLTANVSDDVGVITLTVTAIILENGGEERNVIVERIKEQIDSLLSSCF